MGTNYYRVPKSNEMVYRHQRLINRISNLDVWDPASIANQFSDIKHGDWDTKNAWQEFLEDTNVHLGKRSSGWKFLWNFNNNKYYSNKEELLDYIRKGRVVDEYGKNIDVNEFIEMALEWGEPDGQVFNREYANKHENRNSYWYTSELYFDKNIDGLRVSTSTDFC